MTDSFAGEVNWRIPDRKVVAVDKLAETILSNRGIKASSQLDFLSPNYQHLGDPFKLPDMQLAVDHLLKLRQSKKKVAVYGDYDIDGLTATTILTQVFRDTGFNVESYIPDRFIEGYGLHDAALNDLLTSGVDTVVTVDCGSTAVDQVAVASKAGLNIIVTDHHTLGESELIGALAHINPLRPESNYQESKLAGVGVAFALVRALQKADPKILPIGQEKWLLDLVALGTICDVVPLIGENRTLAYWGLKVMRQGRRPGLRALAQVSGVDLAELKGNDIGFKFGPRLNAAGRLEHARTALDLLLGDDASHSAQAAAHLQSLNADRVDQTAEVLAAARLQAQSQSDQAVLVVADPGWSHGVAGLVASRLAEEFHKPALVLQIEGKTAKGSGRSIGNFRLIDALQAQSKLLERFGGHAAAAGLTIKTKNIDALSRGLHKYCHTEKSKPQFNSLLEADLWLEADWMSATGLQELSRLEPFGHSNPEPLFYFEAVVSGVRPVGQNGQHYQLIVIGDFGQIRMIAFSARERWSWLKTGQQISGLVNLKTSTWQGRIQPDLVVVGLRQGIKRDAK